MSSLAGQASQLIAAPESSANVENEVINSPDSLYQGNNEAAATGGGKSNDSGFFEDAESDAPRVDYKDFQLYQDDLPEIDPDTDRFFADADASTQVHSQFLYSDGSDSGVDFDDDTPDSQLSPCEQDALFFNTIHEVAIIAVSDEVYKALKDYDLRSHLANMLTPPPRDEDVGTTNPLRVWVSTSLRHEFIAYQIWQQEREQQQPVRESEA
ncbi:hypothetical protein ACEPPN_007634 [Leptodophora sp. 'Broadleaf-Isolate-01']